jgi:hypothetical protein
MAFILVLILHISEAYSSMPRQIVMLRVQSKRRPSKAALQPVHGWGHTFFIFFSAFPDWQRRASVFCNGLSHSASAK